MWDADNMFSNQQAVAATGKSGNTVAVPPHDAGKGRPVILEVMIADPVGAGTMTVEVETADNAAMTGAKVIAKHDLDNATLMRGGSVLAAALPTGCLRYLRLAYVIGGTFSAKVTAGLVNGAQTNR